MLNKAFALPVAALIVSACAQEEGGGPLGIVAFDRNHHVSAAEPLFGRDEDRCLDSPAFLMLIYKKEVTLDELEFLPEKSRTTCKEVLAAIQTAMKFGSFHEPKVPPAAAAAEAYTDRQRNEVIDAMMAASNRKCGRYIAFLQQYDANVNSTFGILAQATAILATVSGGGTAKGFAAASGISGGTRGALNNAHFQNQTVAVLTNAFENSRGQQRVDITRRQQCTPARYTLMRGMEDAFRYHTSCSIVFGLKEAQRAVEEAHAPNLENFNRMLDQLALADQKMAKLTGKSDADTAADSNAGAETVPPAAPADATSTGGSSSGSAPGQGATGDAAGSAGASQGVTNPPPGAGGAAASAAATGCPFDPPPKAVAAGNKTAPKTATAPARRRTRRR